jgi:hypothetical protein
MDVQDRQRIETGSIRNAVSRFRLDLAVSRMARLAGVANSVSRWFMADAKWEPPRGEREEWRRKKPDGTYEYSPTKPEELEPAKKPEQEPAKKPQKPVEKKEPTPQSHPQNFKHHVTLSKKQLNRTLSKGHFSIISAGRNPSDPKEAKMKPDDEFFHKRHSELRDELEKKGLKYTEVVGHYSGKETSFMVFHDSTELTPKTVKSIMVHHKDSKELEKNRKMLDEIGAKYKQDSVLYGSGGKFNLSFTSGKNKGKICGGKGWKETPEAEDFYTDIELKDKKHTKFSLDIGGCFEMGLL